MKTFLLVVAVVLLAGPAVGQDVMSVPTAAPPVATFFSGPGNMMRKIEVADSSRPGSPIKFIGSITVKDNIVNGQRNAQEAGDVSVTNTGTKEILALIADIAVQNFRAPGAEIHYMHEFYFKPGGFAPGMTMAVMSPENAGIETTPAPPAGMTIREPQASVNVAWIEFADGSIWGDPKVGTQLVSQRADVYAMLTALVNAYDSGGKSGFQFELGKDGKMGTTARDLQESLRFMAGDSGTAATVANIRGRIATADSRKAAGIN